MNVIESARELGAAIQADEAYIKYAVAKQNNDEDKELQDLIGEFNLLRLNVNQEMSKSEKDEEKSKELNEKLQECYKNVMANKSMMAYNEAKKGLDEVINQINSIIAMSVEGEDPKTCQPASSCSGSCSSCGGCH